MHNPVIVAQSQNTKYSNPMLRHQVQFDGYTRRSKKNLILDWHMTSFLITQLCDHAHRRFKIFSERSTEFIRYPSFRLKKTGRQDLNSDAVKALVVTIFRCVGSAFGAAYVSRAVRVPYTNSTVQVASTSTVKVTWCVSSLSSHVDLRLSLEICYIAMKHTQTHTGVSRFNY